MEKQKPPTESEPIIDSGQVNFLGIRNDSLTEDENKGNADVAGRDKVLAIGP